MQNQRDLIVIVYSEHNGRKGPWNDHTLQYVTIFIPAIMSLTFNLAWVRSVSHPADEISHTWRSAHSLSGRQ